MRRTLLGEFCGDGWKASLSKRQRPCSMHETGIFVSDRILTGRVDFSYSWYRAIDSFSLRASARLYASEKRISSRRGYLG